VICTLIILGGIGFVVLSESTTGLTLSRRTWAFFSLHTKLVLSGTLLIVVFSTGIICLLEWHNTLAHLTWPFRVIGAFFQAVNARTAGFNTVPMGELTNETLFFTCLLMFVGTAPGSCGGGVKITTFASLLILGVSRFKGQTCAQIFNRKISDASMAKAVGLVMISSLVIITGIMLLQQTEIGEVSHALTRGAFLELTFETMSAFGTVGLSTGVTPGLSLAGKLIITLIMFIGRLGPLAIAVAMSRTRPSKPFSYAQENIMIG
jgi:trk system potassium uptake protein TrkH